MMLHNTVENKKLEMTSISLEAAKKLGDEYGQLMIASDLSCAQEARMDEILWLATVHRNVDFWVSLAACDRGADIGLLSPNYLSQYEDQRAVLREQMALETLPDSGIERALLAQVKAAKEKANQDIQRILDEMEHLDRGKARVGERKAR